MMQIILWTCYFLLLLSQGYGIIENLLLQDNTESSIILGQNWKALSGKCKRHINIWYFFITDQVNMKEISIDWCPIKKTLLILWPSLYMVVVTSEIWEITSWVEWDALNPKLMWSVFAGRQDSSWLRRARWTASAVSQWPASSKCRIKVLAQ